MSGPVILRRLVVLSRSRTTQTDPARDFGRKDRQIRRYGCTNGRALDLIRSILGVKLRVWAIAVVLTLFDRTIRLLKPVENIAIFSFDATRVVILTSLSRLAASDFTIGKDQCCVVLGQS